MYYGYFHGLPTLSSFIKASAKCVSRPALCGRIVTAQSVCQRRRTRQQRSLPSFVLIYAQTQLSRKLSAYTFKPLMGVLDLISRTGSKFAFVISKAVSIMQTEKASERDIELMDRALREARTDLAYGGAGVAA